jgi:hypothetical protein
MVSFKKAMSYVIMALVTVLLCFSIAPAAENDTEKVVFGVA